MEVSFHTLKAHAFGGGGRMMRTQSCIVTTHPVRPQIQPTAVTQLSRESLPHGVVDIHNRHTQTWHVKQLAFGLPVSIHALVVIQVILGEIGEYRGIDRDTCESLLFDTDA